jgi:hypothetical protein
MEQSGIRVVTVEAEALPQQPLGTGTFNPAFDFQPTALYQSETSH